MIRINGKEISGIFYNGTEITSLYRNAKLLWEAIVGNFISSDGFVIMGKDNYIINGKE